MLSGLPLSLGNRMIFTNFAAYLVMMCKEIICYDRSRRFLFKFVYGSDRGINNLYIKTNAERIYYICLLWMWTGIQGNGDCVEGHRPYHAGEMYEMRKHSYLSENNILDGQAPVQDGVETDGMSLSVQFCPLQSSCWNVSSCSYSVFLWLTRQILGRFFIMYCLLVCDSRLWYGHKKSDDLPRRPLFSFNRY